MAPSGASTRNPFAILDSDSDSLPPAKKKLPNSLKCKKSRKDVTSEFFPTLPSSNVNAQEAKYLVIESREVESNVGEVPVYKRLDSFNIFKIQAAIRDISSEVIRGSFLRDGHFMILVKNKVVAEKFISRDKLVLSNMVVVKISVGYHKKLNTIKGVVYCPILKHMEAKDIIDGWKDADVLDVRHIPRRDKKGNSGAMIVTFLRFKLPTSVEVCYQRYDVREYVQNPMRCYSCQEMGHTSKFCKGIPRCNKCSSPVHKEECDREYCINCKAVGHSPSAKDCPTFVKEREILRIVNSQRCSRLQARSIYQSLIQQVSLAANTQVSGSKQSNNLCFAQVTKITNNNQKENSDAGTSKNVKSTTKVIPHNSKQSQKQSSSNNSPSTSSNIPTPASSSTSSSSTSPTSIKNNRKILETPVVSENSNINTPLVLTKSQAININSINNSPVSPLPAAGKTYFVSRDQLAQLSDVDKTKVEEFINPQENNILGLA